MPNKLFNTIKIIILRQVFLHLPSREKNLYQLNIRLNILIITVLQIVLVSVNFPIGSVKCESSVFKRSVREPKKEARATFSLQKICLLSSFWKIVCSPFQNKLTGFITE